jgi:hypothetical protein
LELKVPLSRLILMKLLEITLESSIWVAREVGAAAELTGRYLFKKPDAK